MPHEFGASGNRNGLIAFEPLLRRRAALREVRWISTFRLANGSPHWRHRVLWDTQFLDLQI